MSNSKSVLILAFTAVLFISGCQTYDNFTTFFNTYYNAKRLIKETEDEFEYQDEKLRVKPKVFIPQPKYWVKSDQKNGAPPFMNEFVIDARKLQPAKVKLDSVIIKGSKILAKHPKSDYIDNTLFLMAQSYFYMNDWINCQVKCSELIDKFPDGELSPDAHLMIAKTYLIRRKTLTGKTLLSRAIDMAWLQKRYDILSEAFRLEAELALYENDFEEALRPYKQAISQCDDNEQNARWQVDLAALLYRMSKFERAEIAFAKVKNYSPDYQSVYEADLYKAICMIRNKKTDEGMSLLQKLDDDGKFVEWKEYVHAGRMIKFMVNKEDSLFANAEKYADSAYANSTMIHAVYFEKAMIEFDKGQYEVSKKYLAQVRNLRSEYFNTANKLYNMLNTWSQKRQTAIPGLKKYNDGKMDNDSAKSLLASDLFEYARVQELLGNQDSAKYYYKESFRVSPVDSNSTAKYVYNYSRVIRPENPMLSDSLMELLAEKYPKTEYGLDAIHTLGYTQYFVIDSIADIFSSGNQLRKNGEYALAIDKFNTVYEKYPAAKLARKSVYSVGWIYENKLNVADSALKYYSILLKNYPKSEYAKDISLTVAYLSAVKSGSPIPDSLKKKQVFLTPKRDFLKEIEENKLIEIKKSNSFDKQKSIKNDKNPINNIKNSLDPNKYIKDTKDALDPSKALGKPKELIDKPGSLLPGININNPFEDLKKKDSTDTKPKSIEPANEEVKPKK
jgi:TolA-binding protein